MRWFWISGLVLSFLALLILALGWNGEDPWDNTAYAVSPGPSVMDTEVKSITVDMERLFGTLSGSEVTKTETSKKASPAKDPGTSRPSSSESEKTSLVNTVPTQEGTKTEKPQVKEKAELVPGELANKVVGVIPDLIEPIYITTDWYTGDVVVQGVSKEEASLYSIPGEDFLAMTDEERERALKDLLSRYWDAHPEKAPHLELFYGGDDYILGHTKRYLIPIRLWFPEWWFAHFDRDPCNDVSYWHEVPACQEVVKEEPTKGWLSDY
ncbi:MAG: hypothetical protein KM310_00020 [Clostridiales bacterium]|nr:hypothetical protein [Clostridiales bacterium]